MAAVVDRGAVHQDQILVHTAAADAESRRPLAGGLYAGHHLDDADDVRFAHQGGELANQGGVHAFHPHLGQDELLALRTGQDGGRLQFFPVRLQEEVQLDGAAQVALRLAVLVAEVRAADGMRAGGDAEGVESGLVRYGGGLPVLQIDDGLYERLSAGGVEHIARQHVPAPLRSYVLRAAQQDRREEDGPEGAPSHGFSLRFRTGSGNRSS